MKRRLLTACALAAFACAAELVSFDLSDGLSGAVPSGRVAAIAACSTNLAGTVTFKRVTPLSFAWTETVETAVTNTSVSVDGYTNSTVRIVRNTFRRTFDAPATNDVCTLKLASGRGVTNLAGVVALPGDKFLVSGLKGRAKLVVERSAAQ